MLRRCSPPGGWGEVVRTGEPSLVALWPGQGSVLVEAAGMALDRAPGLLRSRWGFAGWAGHDADAWQALLGEAEARAAAGEKNPCSLIVCDGRPGALSACRQALRSAGLPLVPEGCEGTVPSHHLAVADLTWVGETALASEAAALSEPRGVRGRASRRALPRRRAGRQRCAASPPR